MKALVHHGPGSKAWEDVPDTAVADPTDVVVRAETTTICGTGHEALTVVITTG